MEIGVRIALPASCAIFHIINIAFLKISGGGGRLGIEGLKNIIFSSFNLFSGGDEGDRGSLALSGLH